MNPEIVLGPPGTGKTTTLLSIVDEELSAGVPAAKIGYFSFTRRAAEEAVERACKKFSLKRADFPHFRTLHSMCFRQLGLRRGDVLEGKSLQEFADYAGVVISGRWSEDGTLVGYDIGDRAIFIENLSRVGCEDLRDTYNSTQEPGISWHELRRVADCLSVFKEEKALLDYTDMLSEFVDSGVELGLEVLLVDEAQDLSALQWRVVERLSAGCRRVVVAGDDDQAIYAWAGADVEHMVSMEGRERVLARSWRVPPEVQSVAASLVARVENRRPKKWSPREGEGTVERVHDITEVDFDGEDVLVLARNSYLMRQVESVLRHRGIVFERHGHTSIRRAILDAVVGWERLRAGKKITVPEARTVYTMLSSGSGVVRGFKTLPGLGDEDEVDMDTLRRSGGLIAEGLWYDALERIPSTELAYILAALKRGESLTRRPRVRLSTIHSSKGGEADHVVLLLEMARRTYREAENNPDDEARVWYVGVTRARRRLTMVEASSSLRCPWL